MAEIIPAVVKNHYALAATLTSENTTPLLGEIVIESDTGNLKVGDGVTSWVSLPYNTGTFTSVSEINDGVDVEINLPDPALKLDVVLMREESSAGTGKLIPKGYNIGGLAPEIWEIEGAGILVIFPSGGEYKVKEYSDSGSNADGYWEKRENGEMTQRFSGTAVAVPVSQNFAKPFIGIPDYSLGALSASSRVAQLTALSNASYTPTTYRPDNLAATSNDYSIIAIERWRT